MTDGKRVVGGNARAAPVGEQMSKNSASGRGGAWRTIPPKPEPGRTSRLMASTRAFGRDSQNYSEIVALIVG